MLPVLNYLPTAARGIPSWYSGTTLSSGPGPLTHCSLDKYIENSTCRRRDPGCLWSCPQAWLLPALVQCTLPTIVPKLG